MSERKHHKVEQRSPEWFELRKGRFTSSDIDNLLKNGRAKDSIGDTFFSHVFKSVEDEIFGEEDDYDNADMERGRDLEPIAFRWLKEQKGLDFIPVDQCGFFTYGDYEGSSPDALVGSDTVAEIKAPRRSKFLSIVRNGIKAVDQKWISQVQHQMRVTGRTKGLLLFICEIKGEAYYHQIEIDKDESIHAKMEERIQLGIKEKNQYKEYLTNKYI